VHAAEIEKNRKRIEAEALARDSAEAKKDKIRPRDFTNEEKKSWKEYAVVMSDFFGEIVMK
jgi:hypothetical protein